MVEISEVTVCPPSGDWLHGANVDIPSGGDTSDTYSFDVEGWVLGKAAPVTCVEVLQDGWPVLDIPLATDRPDIASAFPGVTGAGRSGFSGSIGALSLQAEFTVSLRARLEDGSRLPLARIVGRRRELPADHRPRIQPLMINTIGRSGSTWLASLLGCHPQIVAFQPFANDARVSAYWMSVLQALSQPHSFLRQLLPQDLGTRRWWLGDGGSIRALADPEIAVWLGGENVESLASMCLGRIEAFYARVADPQEAAPRYFVEKFLPYQVEADLLWEIYPGAREVILVRDLRDMLSSILAFNVRRGYQAFGREQSESDAEYVTSWLRPSADAVLDRWRRRAGIAYLLRYEDLVLEPRQTLAKLARYLGLGPSPETIEETLGRASRDNVELHRTAPDPVSSIGRWRRDLPPELIEVCEESLNPLLAELGYSTERDVEPQAEAR